MSTKSKLGPLRAVLVISALALLSTGCLPMLFLRDARCDGFTIDDPLLKIHFVVWTETPPTGVNPPRPGVAPPRPEALHLSVGHDGEASMVHEPKNRELLRGRCRPLEVDDLAEVTRAVERLEHAVVAERRIRHPGCRQGMTIVLRDDHLLKTFGYCGTTPPAEVVRFIEEISVPLGRRFGKELATGLAATAPWASPVPFDPSGG